MQKNSTSFKKQDSKLEFVVNKKQTNKQNKKCYQLLTRNLVCCVSLCTDTFDKVFIEEHLLSTNFTASYRGLRNGVFCAFLSYLYKIQS